jgi:hypothetical protein
MSSVRRSNFPGLNRSVSVMETDSFFFHRRRVGHIFSVRPLGEESFSPPEPQLELASDESEKEHADIFTAFKSALSCLILVLSFSDLLRNSSIALAWICVSSALVG